MYEIWIAVTETETGCWEWPGEKSPSGYASFRTHKGGAKRHMLARAVLSILGRLHDGHEVIHVCDNPACIRPEHLRSGTHRENIRDAVDKGRAAVGAKNGMWKHGKYAGLRRRDDNGIRRMISPEGRVRAA